MSAIPDAHPATLDDLRALDGEGAWELVEGSLVQKASPSMRHGWAQSSIVGAARLSGGGWTNRREGWWIVSEVEIRLSDHTVLRPDLTGWRRSTLPELPDDWPVATRPDWVCEVLSDGTRRYDLATKQRLFHAHGVPWLWYADPRAALVQVLRWEPDGYLIVATAQPGEERGLPPFEDVPLSVNDVFAITPEGEGDGEAAGGGDEAAPAASSQADTAD